MLQENFYDMRARFEHGMLSIDALFPLEHKLAQIETITRIMGYNWGPPLLESNSSLTAIATI